MRAGVVRGPESVDLRRGNNEVEADQECDPDEDDPLQASDIRALRQGRHALAETPPMLLCLPQACSADMQPTLVRRLPAPIIANVLRDLGQTRFEQRARPALREDVQGTQEPVFAGCFDAQVEGEQGAVCPCAVYWHLQGWNGPTIFAAPLLPDQDHAPCAMNGGNHDKRDDGGVV